MSERTWFDTASATSGSGPGRCRIPHHEQEGQRRRHRGRRRQPARRKGHHHAGLAPERAAHAIAQFGGRRLARQPMAKQIAQRQQLVAAAAAIGAILHVLLDGQRVNEVQFAIEIRLQQRPRFVTVHGLGMG